MLSKGGYFFVFRMIYRADPLVKSDLCLIGLFSCSANFITRFVIPSPSIFLLCTTKLCIPTGGTRLFLSSLFVLVSVCSLPCSQPPVSRVSSKQKSRRFRNQVVPPFRFYPVCIRNPFLGGKLFYIPPYLIFSPFSY